METSSLTSIFPYQLPQPLQNLQILDAVKAPILTISNAPNKATFDTLPQDVQVAIAGVLNSVANLSTADKTNHTKLGETLIQNPLLKVTPNSDLSASTQLLKKVSAFSPSNLISDSRIKQFLDKLSSLAGFKPDSSGDSSSELGESQPSADPSKKKITPEEVQSWLASLTRSNPEITHNLDLNFYAQILAYMGQNFKTLKENPQPTRVLELVVLKFPSNTSQFFELFSLNVRIWAESQGDIIKKEQAGLTGDFTFKQFEPRDNVINSLPEDTRNTAISQAKDKLAS